MLLRPRFLILDEPTASLEPSAAAQRVLDLMGRLRDRASASASSATGSTRSCAIGDRITVLRDGAAVAALPNAETDEAKLADLITGGLDKAEAAKRRDWQPSGDVVLRVTRRPRGARAAHALVRGRARRDLRAHRPARSRAPRRSCGCSAAPSHWTGSSSWTGSRAGSGTPARRTACGIGFIPEDRKGAGLISEQSIALNVSLPSLPSVSRGGMLNWPAINGAGRAVPRRPVDQDRLRATQPVWTLSGGNQQKVMLAKWLASGVKVLAIEEPTHGVDIGAKLQVHDLLRDFANTGGTVVVASTDVGEVLDLCDRIGVMRHGELAEIVSADELTKSAVTVLGTRDPEQMLETLIESDTAPAVAAGGKGAK